MSCLGRGLIIARGGVWAATGGVRNGKCSWSCGGRALKVQESTAEAHWMDLPKWRPL